MSKKYVLITGDHPRHLYFANALAKQCDLSSLFLEKREEFIPKPPTEIVDGDRENFIKHFENRAHYEKKYFGDKQVFPDVDHHYVDKNDLDDSIRKIEVLHPDVIFVFGTLSLARELKSKYGGKIQWVNLNTGIMQRYNGAATLFWPFYFLEPQWAGSTFHFMDNDENEVAIIHQSLPELLRGDSIHEVAAKVVVASTKDLGKIIQYLEERIQTPYKKVKLAGKLFDNSDFRVEHLSVIYNLYNDKIVDYYLDGYLGQEPSGLITLNTGDE